MNIANDFYNLRFADAFEALFHDAFVGQNEIDNLESNSDKILNLLFDNEAPEVNYTRINTLLSKFEFKNGTYELTDVELRSIARYLDFVIRITLGQWTEIYNLVNATIGQFGYSPEKENELGKIRNEMIPKFNNECIFTIFASFGIYNKKLNPKILVNYAIYKKIMFELLGSASDDSICTPGYTENISIILPPRGEIVSNGDNEAVKKFIDELAEIEHMCLYRDSLYFQDHDTLYVYVNQNVSIAIAAGTKITIQHNSWPIVERDGVVYDYNTAPKM